MNGYNLSRFYFNWAFENPEKVTPTHTAVYFFAVEHCNRLGWKKKFGFPSQMAMEALGIKSYNTYIKCFRNLCDWGFFQLIEKSQNQYSANIIAISNFDKALDEPRDKALDKALINHSTKHSESTRQSNDSIDKPYNQQTNKPTNQEREHDSNFDQEKIPSLDEVIVEADMRMIPRNKATFWFEAMEGSQPPWTVVRGKDKVLPISHWRQKFHKDCGPNGFVTREFNNYSQSKNGTPNQPKSSIAQYREFNSKVNALFPE